jgi:hypothetical protein
MRPQFILTCLTTRKHTALSYIFLLHFSFSKGEIDESAAMQRRKLVYNETAKEIVLKPHRKYIESANQTSQYTMNDIDKHVDVLPRTVKLNIQISATTASSRWSIYDNGYRQVGVRVRDS